MMKTMALVVPCYNEARRLDASAFIKAVERHPWLTFEFVDDGSDDATLDVLSHLERLSPAFDLIHLPKNRGKAEAVRAGVHRLLVRSTAELIGFWDADLATPLSEVTEFRRAFLYDARLLAAIGSRWPHLGGDVRRRFGRGVSSWIVKSSVRARLGVDAWDTQCGAKVFARAAAAELFREPFRTRWLFDVELLARLGRHRLAHCVRELPVDSWRDVPDSKLSLAAFPRIIGELLRLPRVRVL